MPEKPEKPEFANLGDKKTEIMSLKKSFEGFDHKVAASENPVCRTCRVAGFLQRS